jgi:DNA-nicking Smr family endonuclease
MTKQSKDGGEGASSEGQSTKPDDVATSLGPLVRAAHISSAAAPKPKASRSAAPQPRRQPATPEERSRELAARKRVAGLVSGGLHFKIKREGDRVQGQRGASSSKFVARLTSKGFSPEVTLDLRGQPMANAREAIASFVSLHHRRGVKQMSIVFDPAAGEADATSGVEAVLAALTLGPAGALVRAFSSVRESVGVTTELAVLLI